MRVANVFLRDDFAGKLIENDDGEYSFTYDPNYLLSSANPQPISLTLPCAKTPYMAKALFPFFDGLIPEGWLLDLAVKNWKLKNTDRMGLLLEVCEDCIGAVSIRRVEQR